MMNLYTKSLSEQSISTTYSYAPTNEQAAWFAIAYSAACIEGDISEEGRETLCRLVASKQLYQGHEIIDYFYELMEVEGEIEAKEIIHRAAKLVSPEDAPTLFCIVTETLLAKGYLTEKEEDILEYTSRELVLDRKIAKEIIDVFFIKSKGNIIYR